MRTVLLFTIGALLFLCHTAVGQDGKSLSADLAFHFDCKGNALPPSDDKIEGFLRGQDFRVLNKVRLAREHHVFYPYTLDIIAIDSARRIITLNGIPTSPGTYSIALNTPPPTHHAVDLESRLQDFISNGLGCPVRQVARHENGKEARDFFDRIFKRAEGWFEQANQMQQPPA